MLMLHSFNKLTHYTINIKCINYTGLPKYIYLSLTECCGDLWESELDITGLVFFLYPNDILKNWLS